MESTDTKFARPSRATQRRDVMQDPQDQKRKSFSAFRSAAEESEMKAQSAAAKREGGHMSSTSGQVRHDPGAELPFVVTLTHSGGEPTEHGFATMRQAEAFVKRNTPVPGRTLSALYDRPPSDS
jgi:hypothetical protein